MKPKKNILLINYVIIIIKNGTCNKVDVTTMVHKSHQMALLHTVYIINTNNSNTLRWISWSKCFNHRRKIMFFRGAANSSAIRPLAPAGSRLQGYFHVEKVFNKNLPQKRNHHPKNSGNKGTAQNVSPIQSNDIEDLIYKTAVHSHYKLTRII